MTPKEVHRADGLLRERDGALNELKRASALPPTKVFYDNNHIPFLVTKGMVLSQLNDKVAAIDAELSQLGVSPLYELAEGK